MLWREIRLAHILFIDDDSITLRMLEKIATMAGHVPHTAQSGQVGVERASELGPDLIVVDMMMPDMDGLAVISKLKAQPDTAAIPVVVLSAGPEIDAEERITAAGAQAYLPKPISMDALLEVIGAHTKP